MKSILVAISGTVSDSAVLDAAFAIAAPLKAHLDFVHIPLAAIEAADFNHHIEFARGCGLEGALKEVLPRSKEAETKARAHVTSFCDSKAIFWTSQPPSIDRLSASWIECPITPAIDGLTRIARTYDLTVIGRSAGKRSWSQKLLESLVTDSGRPVLVVPTASNKPDFARIAIWWKDHSPSARAVTAALPILGGAQSINIISVRESDEDLQGTTEYLARQLGWHDVRAKAETLTRHHRPVIDILWSASLVRKADLIVMGGFSRSRIREMIFGGCTQAVLESGLRPVFLLH
jgi:nucleotide-binding universal stress UspA family protein